MSIVAYTGLPGAGKSYGAVEHQIMPALKAGRTVVTNIPLRMENVEALKLPGSIVEFPVETVAAEPHRVFDYVTAGCVWVLDEVWRLFPQGMQVNKVPPEFQKLLAEHRHMVDAQGNSTQIVLVVQDLANIAAFARRLVEETFVITKLGFVGMNKSFRVDVFHGAMTGATPSVSSRLRMITGRYRKEVYALYKSHTMAVDDEQVGANEQKIDGRANILKRPAFIIGAIACPLIIWYSLHTFSKAFHGGFGVQSQASAAEKQSAPARSGAERVATPVATSARTKEEISSPRVLMEVLDSKHPERQGVYVSDGVRLVLLTLDSCVRVIRELQCSYDGAVYDSRGLVWQVGKPVM